MDMNKKNRMTLAQLGTPSHMVVWPWKRASRVTAKANPSRAKDMAQRSQKKMFWAMLRGGSLDSMGLPESLATIMAITYEEWRIPEYSKASAT